MEILENVTFCRPGIYCLVNVQNGKKYIGSSLNISQRLYKHRSLLRNNKHENAYLQNAWNKYGEQYFIYSILEFCNKNNLSEREQLWINSCNPEYNITKQVIRNILSKESRIKQSQTRKELFKMGVIKPSRRSKINQYTLNGKFIKTWETIKEAAKYHNIHETTIIKCIKGKAAQGKGYIWKYFNDFSEIIPCHNSKRTVYLDLIKQGELLETPTDGSEDNQQPSLSSNTLEGSTTNSRVLPSNVEDSNANTSALPLSK